MLRLGDGLIWLHTVDRQIHCGYIVEAECDAEWLTIARADCGQALTRVKRVSVVSVSGDVRVEP